MTADEPIDGPLLRAPGEILLDAVATVDLALDAEIDIGTASGDLGNEFRRALDAVGPARRLRPDRRIQDG